jgi:hypothetical protein
MTVEFYKNRPSLIFAVSKMAVKFTKNNSVFKTNNYLAFPKGFFYNTFPAPEKNEVENLEFDGNFFFIHL